MLNVSVIGVGYWGPNLVRNFAANPRARVVSCCDLAQNRLDLIRRTYPSIETTTDYRAVLKDTKTDLVVLCTPVSTHFEIARAALLAGKHVLIEKPMTSTTAEAEELVELAARKQLKLFVDHTFIYTGAVRRIKELIDNGELGKLYYFDSVRVNLGLFQHDVNVLWDLAPHDVSIMHHLLPGKPESVVATGIDNFGNGLENVAYLTVYYPDHLIAHVHTNWLSPVKIRQTLLAGSKRMVVWDDNQPSEKVRIYDKGVDVVQSADDVYHMLVQYRTGDMYCPKIDSREALAVEVERIIDCLEKGTDGVVGGEDGLMVVRILEAAQQSVKARGKEVRI
ncbi:MAG: Gfo/Idh/MocA family oxidoreductase [candidate division KSB1 bacterium]|nr:Gfo/Idh/MocA family oxidoreductase [candidate division KSB1 bacterium]MDZ7384630.1 Gfo/Idh/MocA family oxidoreductase [candidate division KSB1 bacterium]MDZ7392155.1 Gfo/Idh/MocA family oxidoreductase [candidate division KSB1 bacterium]MDZ7413604.1 Gfo/Idh/MocA family oxidoreductase [candidate division KSB1 bacterium]